MAFFRFIFLIVSFIMLCMSCKQQRSQFAGNEDQKNIIESILPYTDSSVSLPFVKQRLEIIRQAMLQPKPVILCTDSLTMEQKLAELIALSDSGFTRFLWDGDKKYPLRNEIFGVYPARESDMAGIKEPYTLTSCYRVEMYNYALNSTSVAIVDIEKQKLLNSFYLAQSQPDIPQSLIQLATKIAVESPEVQNALGYKPEEKEALMASTKTALNRTRCERSKHLCVAPTFIKADKALWAIVDLTDYRLVGIRWTNVGTTGPAAPLLTERRLLDDKITSCYCEKEQKLIRNGWSVKYMLTSSDGLRISDVLFNNVPVLQSAKLVDWHVSYSGTDGFGYSDAVGCPYFSQSAVIAWETPRVLDLFDGNKNKLGFVLEQTFRSENWPTPCQYNYKQRYEFYFDGRFRISCASLGRGCGNTGTYRPVFRIVFAGRQHQFFEYSQAKWVKWDKEQWQLQKENTSYTSQGYQYKIVAEGNNYFMEPGKGQFNDGGRGDFAYVYITRKHEGLDEGESDLVTIGPCCNTDYRQGPEKFIEPNPESLQDAPIVLWYVPQLRNDDRKGNEYCWAENVLVNGVYETKVYPCFAGPLFIPEKIKP